MTPLEFAGILVLGGIGLVSVCLLLIRLGLMALERECDECRFRRELRKAQALEATHYQGLQPNTENRRRREHADLLRAG